MLDQSFSAKNFAKIIGLENRKGNDLESTYFSDITTITSKLKDNRKSFKVLKQRKTSLSNEEYLKQKKNLNLRKEKLKKEKKDKLEAELTEASNRLAKMKYKVNVSNICSIKGKPVYKSGETIEEYLAIKQVQENISKLYKVKQSNRELILPQLREVIKGKMPKLVIRTDISSFYESIDRKRLTNKLSKDGLLSHASLAVINSILNSYGILSESNKGIPRGIGLSAYLAEIYMRSFDQYIRSIEGIIYYARYVDDIVAVYCHRPNADHKSLLFSTVKRLFKKEGLRRNKRKSEIISISENDGNEKELTYLGYKFIYTCGNVRMRMSTAKLERYKLRIERAFDEYERSRYNKNKSARRLIISRVKLLTGNTRLLNNKKRAYIGIYFSNSLITERHDLKVLDGFLKGCINKLASNSLKTQLSLYSFETGFKDKCFYRFTAARLKSAVAHWKPHHE